MMHLFLKSALWRHGPFLDLRIPPCRHNLLSRLCFTRPPSTPNRALAHAARASSPAKSTANPSSQALSRQGRTPPTSTTKTHASYASPQSQYTSRLTSRRSPTTLYQSPPTFTYPLACALIGGGSIAYGVYNFYDIFMLPHPGLSWFIPWLMAFVCVFMVGVGVWIMRNGTRLIGRVSAVPRGEGLMVRIETRGLFGRRVFERPIADVRVGQDLIEARSEGLPTAQAPATAAGRRAAEVAKRKADREAYQDMLKTNPLKPATRWVGGSFSRMSRGIRRIVGREGFAELSVRRKDGGKWQAWKMDVADGWCAEGGTGLLRLLGR